MEEQRIRICDIAEELGVNTATVSNVIHGKTEKISDKTVKRVMALLEEREYIPSMAGILLSQNSSKIIGVFVNDHKKYEGHTLEDFFISSSLNYLSKEIEKRELFMMVKKAKDAKEVLKFASMWNMEGLVMIGFCEQDYMYLRDHMRIPFVVYDGFCSHPERFVNISIDNENGGYQVGRHFKDKGHENVLCISDNALCMDLKRYQGFCEGFGSYDIPLMLIPMKKEECWEFYLDNLEAFLSVTAVFAVSDHYACDLICFLQSQGIKVPEEISVVGFDDTPICSMVWPPLSSVKQDSELRARLALDKLKELKEKYEDEIETEIKLPVKLVVRESSI